MALDAAREIVEAEGLSGLSTRRIAKAIGYTAGTLYQLFDGLDDLIVHLNTETLDELLQACRDVQLTVGAEPALQQLAGVYIRYVGEHQRLWNALFEHSLPGERTMPDWFYERIDKLLGLANTALSSLTIEDDRHGSLHDARVLWAGLYGIASLASSGKLAKSETPEALVRSLVTNYVAGLRAKRQRTSR